MIPTQDLRNVLLSYKKIYSLVTNSQQAYKYVCSRLRSSVIYLLKMLVFTIIAVITGIIAVNSNYFGLPNLFLIIAVIAIILGFFTFESQKGSKRKPRIGRVFNIENLCENIIELNKFKKLIGSKRSILSMIFFVKSNKDDKLIERYLYTFGIGKDLNEAISKYNKTYKQYPDYINFDKHWHIASELFSYVDGNRATTGKEALQYYDLQKHRAKVQYQIERQNDINQAIVDAERERIRAVMEKKKAADNYTTAVTQMTQTINNNGGVSHDDAVNLTDSLNNASQSLEDK